MQNIQTIIAIASGKGGVGKSTVSVNLALALQATGARVGLLDADIYGPSQALMLGVAAGTRPEQTDKVWLPIMAHGLQTMSMSYLVTEKTPLIWRGPMVSGMLQQLFSQTRWDALDYLIIDLPPGTGDIQLTLAQHIPVSGAIIVTTPQTIALLDAQKAIEMFRKVNVPLLGIIENMATSHCPQCGHQDAIFDHGGGTHIAQDYAVPLLGSLPLTATTREQTDSGRPPVIADPHGETAQRYHTVAEAIIQQLAQLSAQQTTPVDIVIRDD